MQPEPAVVFVRRVTEPDFGALELWRGHFLEWRGKTKLPDGEEAAVIIPVVDDDVPADDTLGFLTAASRATFRRIVDDEAKVRRLVCHRELGMAQSWAASGDLPELDAESFAASLRTDSYYIYADKDGVSIEIWFEDTMDIFAGHVFCATYDGEGELQDVALMS